MEILKENIIMTFTVHKSYLSNRTNYDIHLDISVALQPSKIICKYRLIIVTYRFSHSIEASNKLQGLEVCSPVHA